MITNLLLLIFGLYVLVKGSDFLVDGSSSIAKKFHIKPIVIGMTVVAFGTSMPELIVSIIASFNNSNSLVMGNIVGSNISNILLVLGVTAMFVKIKVQKSVLYKEIPFSFFSVLLLFLVLNGSFLKGKDVLITRTHGIVMLSFFVLFLIYLFQTARKSEVKELEEVVKTRTRKSLAHILFGALGLYFGGELIVNNAITIAQHLRINEFVISASIIAIGTSLPELVTSVTAAKKGKIDMAVGNIVGSNIFNILWILGVTSVVKPVMVLNFIKADLLILMATTIVLFLTIYINKNQEITKSRGIIYVILYAIYISFIILRSLV